jgi:hypothetical protein
LTLTETPAIDNFTKSATERPDHSKHKARDRLKVSFSDPANSSRLPTTTCRVKSEAPTIDARSIRPRPRCISAPRRIRPWCRLGYASGLVEGRVLGPIELVDGVSMVRLPRAERTLLAALASRGEELNTSAAITVNGSHFTTVKNVFRSNAVAVNGFRRHRPATNSR